MMNIGQECSLTQAATHGCNNEHTLLDTYKHIASEVFARAKQGDNTAFEILKTVFDNQEEVKA